MKNLDAKLIDKVTLQLFFFILLVISLFFYLYNVEKNIHDYSQNHEKIMQMKLIDKELNDFALTTNQFKNYDAINQNLHLFQTTLTSLRHTLHTKNNQPINTQLQILQKEFTEKRENIELFKSLNASLISGSHFLFDLQTTLVEDTTLSFHLKSIINEALFYLLRYISSDYITKEYVLKKLSKVQQITKKTHHPFIDNFYHQSLMMLETITSLKEVSLAISNSHLYKHLIELDTILDTHYKHNLAIQKNITILFFISTVIILITLIITHIRSLKNERELYAFKYAVHHSDNTVIITDPQRKITYVNDIFEKTTGYTEEEVLGKNPSILKSGLQDEAFYNKMNEKLNKGKRWEGELINRRKNGALYYEKVSIVPMFLNKKLLGYLAIKLDITQYIKQNQQLAQAASVFENTEEAIVIANANGEVLSINNAFTKFYGYTLEEVQGSNLSLLHSGIQKSAFYKKMWQEIQNKGFWKGKIVNKTKSEMLLPVWETIKKVTNEDGKIINFIAIQTDLRELERSQAKADYLAYHDALTGLSNRVSFEDHLFKLLASAEDEKLTFALLFIDLDRFKVINDTLGHDIGDAVLNIIAKRLTRVLKEGTLISRWGGDEFVVILENISSTGEISIITTNILNSLKAPMEIASHHLVTSASIGISIYPDNGTDANTLIKHADSAMYLAKDMGKNTFRYYTEDLSQKIQERLKIDMALHNALAQHEIFMVFQPQYDLQTKKIISLEALVRWKNKDLGRLSPELFIPVAEDSGLIVSLGYFIFEESCKAFKKMKESGLELQHIAINVSAIQFKETHLLDIFLSLVRRYELTPQEIELEITERFIMENTQTNMAMLQTFKDHGFKISIDDFGTGYSSMSYLKQLPANTIKIDKSFIDDIAEGSSDNLIIEAITALSKALGYTIVAEGIETQEQEDFLASIKCDIGQGYLFSKPISCQEVIERFTN